MSKNGGFKRSRLWVPAGSVAVSQHSVRFRHKEWGKVFHSPVGWFYIFPIAADMKSAPQHQ